LAGSGSISLGGLSGFSGVLNDQVPAGSGFQGYVVVDFPSLIGFETYRDHADIELFALFQNPNAFAPGCCHSWPAQGYRTKLMLVSLRRRNESGFHSPRTLGAF